MILDALPPSWTRVRLGDICTQVRRSNPTELGRESFLYIDIGSIDNSSFVVTSPTLTETRDAPSRARQVVRAGDTIFSTVRPYLKKIAYIDTYLDGEIASTGFCVIRPGPGIEPRFIFHLATSEWFIDLVTRQQYGVSYPAVRAEHILGIEVPLPPLSEQRRIVMAIESKLELINSGVSKVRSARKNLLTWNELLLARAVGGNLGRPLGGSGAALLSDIRSRRSSISPKPRTAPAPAPLDRYTVPNGWEIASLGELSFNWSYGTSTRCDYEAAGSPVIRIPNIVNGKVNATEDMKFAVDASLDLSGLFLNAGDLLFIRTNGSPDLIGRIGIVDKSIEAAYASYLIRFRLIPDGIFPDWVRIVVNSPAWRRHIVSKAASSAGQYNLNSITLAAIPIPIPPRDEQLRIIAQLNLMQEHGTALERTISLTGSRAGFLRESILNLALSGRLVKENIENG